MARDTGALDLAGAAGGRGHGADVDARADVRGVAQRRAGADAVARVNLEIVVRHDSLTIHSRLVNLSTSLLGFRSSRGTGIGLFGEPESGA